jgi:beta-lactamase regulating signal transducer with metallopeptidase domain/lipopolysaccharide export system protein LptA
MTAADVVDALLKINLASGAAILAVVALRKLARTRFGARLAYGLWLLPVLAGAAVLLPARQVVVVQPAAPIAAVSLRIGQAFGSPPPAHAVAAAPTGLDGSALLVALWLAGAAGAALVMALLQHRFVARARQGGVGPAVVGVIAPRILIPRDFAERYSPNEQALVLAHEQAHLARQDSRLNGLAAAAQCLGWFNPLVHLAARLMRVDQELACDEAVTNRFPDARRAYAEVLMKAQLAVLPLPLGCYWPSKSQHPLVERVAMLKRPRIGQARWRAGAAALGCLWAGAGVTAWASQPAEVRTVFKTAAVAEGAGAAKGKDGNASSTAYPMRADQAFHDEAHHIDILKGHVVFNGLDVKTVGGASYVETARKWRITSDLLVMPRYADEPGVPDSKKITWEGNVVVDHGDDAARADYAYYDFGSKTLTLTGHVAVDKGRWVVRNDRLVIEAKDLWRAPGPAPHAQADAPDRPTAVALAEAAPPPKPIQLGLPAPVVEHVLIVGAQRIDQETILSLLGIRPGDSMTADKLNAAEKALFDSGLFAETRMQAPPRGGSGDLRLWVKENPLIDQLRFEGNANLKDDQLRAVMRERPGEVYTGAKLHNDLDAVVGLYRQAGWSNAKVSFDAHSGPENRIDLTFTIDEGAKGPAGAPAPGSWSVNAETLTRTGDWVEARGDVETTEGDWRVSSDRLGLSAPLDQHFDIKKVEWEGHVFVDTGEDAARGDYAVYEAASKTITLSGHVVVERGKGVVQNDRLVIAVKDK